MMFPVQKTARDFEELVQENKYEEASLLLSDDEFQFMSPFGKFKSKKEWLKKFPRAHATMPTILFGEYHEQNPNQVERRGSKKVALFTINVKQVIEVDKDGKIKRISASKE
ncbi:expressed unknown protein [Seminavis robusta]|uniref:Uncharacterized protein n=1 Tax=Seminavis robusta TaxID=568900 RepID=A0A9N8H3X1_9STRA|nr:expressed unknown protein [Seminavis robusta]|eukprot:Sro35_g022580.1 n/a (111) ;mRNA; f:133520-133938